MGERDGDTPPDTTSSAVPSVVPWLQAIGILAIAGLGIIDLNVLDAEVPFVVYGGIVAIIWGLGPDTIKATLKRLGQ